MAISTLGPIWDSRGMPPATTTPMETECKDEWLHSSSHHHHHHHRGAPVWQIAGHRPPPPPQHFSDPMDGVTFTGFQENAFRIARSWCCCNMEAIAFYNKLITLCQHGLGVRFPHASNTFMEKTHILHRCALKKNLYY